MVKIIRLDHNGKGIGKLNNKIVFVENALPEEDVEINIIKEKKNYIEATVKKYLKISKDRVTPNCPYYDKCGGCNIMHLSYEKQLEFKQNKIVNIISKYLNKDIKINNIEYSNQFNYRNKTTFHINNDIGFFKDKTNELIKIDNCLISDKIINDSIKYLNKLDLSKINKIICRVNNNNLMIIIYGNNDINIDCLKLIANSIYINDKLVFNEKYNYQNLGNYKFAISPQSFFQVNNDVCKKMYDKIKENINEKENVLDLYCGTGTIGIYTNKDNNTIGVEINCFSVENANINKELNNIKNIKFICDDVSNVIDKFKNIDTIIIDPPRSGLSNIAINNIIKINPQKIIYVSCDPMTLVRDLEKLNKHYDIKEITPFDMFPNTKHVECVCFLKLK